MRTIRLALAALLVAAALVLIAYPVFADGVYHSEHIALASVNGLPLQSGFVENIHANGPTVYMHENYVLNGARPNTTFYVWFWVYPDPACMMEPVLVTSFASITTNVAGNGQTQEMYSEPLPLGHGTTIGMRWELQWPNVPDEPEYATQCTTIVWD